jgi:hypothetical protein
MEQLFGTIIYRKKDGTWKIQIWGQENLNVKDLTITHNILETYHNKTPVQEEIHCNKISVTQF